MTETQFRNKVTWFSFAFSLLVVWVHAYNVESPYGVNPGMEAVYRVEHWFGDTLGQIAVPGFFMLSGYLFYRDFTWEKLRGKWQRRIRSVLVPFILWNFFYYLGYVTGSRLPWLTDVVGKGIVPLSLQAAVDAVIHYTYNYVFWYLYQLMLLILLAPVLYPVLRHRWLRVLFLGSCWLLFLAGLRLPQVNLDALIYYGTAASLALAAQKRQRETGGGAFRGGEREGTGKAVPMDMAEQTVRTGCGVVEQAGSFTRAVTGTVFVALAAVVYRAGLAAAFTPAFALCRVLAVAGLWLVIPGEKLPRAHDMMRHSFFLYATHFAFVRLINKIVLLIPSVTGGGLLALYLLMPALMLGISTVLGTGMRRFTPRIWLLLNGGR